MRIEDVEAEMKELDGLFIYEKVHKFYNWWKKEDDLPWSEMVTELERDGIEEMIMRYNIEKEEV